MFPKTAERYTSILPWLALFFWLLEYSLSSSTEEVHILVQDVKLEEKNICTFMDKGEKKTIDFGDKKVVCLSNRTEIFPPIPDMEYEGITYSSIDYKKSGISGIPMEFALHKFKLNDTDFDKLRIIRIYEILYDSTQRAMRLSSANEKSLLRGLISVREFLSFQAARLEKDQERIKTGLEQCLKNCIFCKIEQRYDLIAIASQSGIDPDPYLVGLKGAKCNSSKECNELVEDIKRKKNKEEKGLDAPLQLAKSFSVKRKKSASSFFWLLSIYFFSSLVMDFSFI